MCMRRTYTVRCTVRVEEGVRKEEQCAGDERDAETRDEERLGDQVAAVVEQLADHKAHEREPEILDRLHHTCARTSTLRVQCTINFVFTL